MADREHNPRSSSTTTQNNPSNEKSTSLSAPSPCSQSSPSTSIRQDSSSHQIPETPSVNLPKSNSEDDIKLPHEDEVQYPIDYSTQIPNTPTCNLPSGAPELNLPTSSYSTVQGGTKCTDPLAQDVVPRTFFYLQMNRPYDRRVRDDFADNDFMDMYDEQPDAKNNNGFTSKPSESVTDSTKSKRTLSSAHSLPTSSSTDEQSSSSVPNKRLKLDDPEKLVDDKDAGTSKDSAAATSQPRGDSDKSYPCNS